MIIGVTGGIGSGKSYMTTLLANQLNAPRLSADEIVAEITGPGGKGIEKIRESFGDDFINDEGGLNRLRMRELIFRDKNAKVLLEKLTTPIINEELTRAIKISKEKCGLVVVEIPLLYESPYWQENCNFVVNIACKRETQVKMVQERNKFAVELVNQIIDSQATPEQRESIAHFTIDNDEGSPIDEQLIKAKESILNTFKSNFRMKI